jgi:lysophospholipase L1-like esterase
MLGIAIALVLAARDTARSQAPPPRPVLLVLGDSIAAGFGASDPARHGFAALVYELLKTSTTDLELINLATPGETSASYSQGGQSSQQDRAAAVLRTRRVAGIVLLVGGNDLLTLIAPGQPCDLSRAKRGSDLAAVALSEPCRTAVDAAIDGVRLRLGPILSALVQAKEHSTPLLVGLYYNPFDLGLDPTLTAATNENTNRLNAVIGEAVSAFRSPDLRTFDMNAAFAGRIATLTRASDRDVHPNDLGHRVIAEAVVRALSAGATGYFSGSPSGPAGCPQAGRWQLLYWRGPAASLSAASVLCPLVDRFWLHRQGRWLAVAPLIPQASDPVSLLTGEAVFAHGGP